MMVRTMKLSWLFFLGCCPMVAEGFRLGLLRVESGASSKENMADSQEFGLSNQEDFHDAYRELLGFADLSLSIVSSLEYEAPASDTTSAPTVSPTPLPTEEPTSTPTVIATTAPTVSATDPSTSPPTPGVPLVNGGSSTPAPTAANQTATNPQSGFQASANEANGNGGSSNGPTPGQWTMIVVLAVAAATVGGAVVARKMYMTRRAAGSSDASMSVASSIQPSAVPSAGQQSDLVDVHI